MLYKGRVPVHECYFFVSLAALCVAVSPALPPLLSRKKRFLPSVNSFCLPPFRVRLSLALSLSFFCKSYVFVHCASDCNARAPTPQNVVFLWSPSQRRRHRLATPVFVLFAVSLRRHRHHRNFGSVVVVFRISRCGVACVCVFVCVCSVCVCVVLCVQRRWMDRWGMEELWLVGHSANTAAAHTAKLSSSH